MLNRSMIEVKGLLRISFSLKKIIFKEIIDIFGKNYVYFGTIYNTVQINNSNFEHSINMPIYIIFFFYFANTAIELFILHTYLYLNA